MVVGCGSRNVGKEVVVVVVSDQWSQVLSLRLGLCQVEVEVEVGVEGSLVDCDSVNLALGHWHI